MHRSPKAEARIEAYLAEVGRRLEHRTEPIRRELLAELREHIEEALRRKGHGAGIQDVEAVLADMDPPESFADPGAPAEAKRDPPASAPARRADVRWFVLGLCLLLVNGYGVWSWTRSSPDRAGFPSERVRFTPGADATVSGRQPLSWFFADPVTADSPAPFEIDPPVPGRYSWAADRRNLVFEPKDAWPPCRVFRARPSAEIELAGAPAVSFRSEPLALANVEQVGISAAHETTLRLVFNGPPDLGQLSRYLALKGDPSHKLPYEILSPAGSNAVLIRTAPVPRDSIQLTLNAGLPASGAPLGLARTTVIDVPVSPRFAFTRLWPYSPPFGPAKLVICFNQEPDLNTASRISVSPPVRFTVEPLERWEQRPGLKLVGDFKPGTTYQVTLPAKLASTTGAALEEDIVRLAQFPDRGPSIAIAAPGRYLSPRGNLAIPLTTVNLRRYTAALARVFPNNLVHLALRETGRVYAYSPRMHGLVGRETAVTNHLPDKRNEEVRATVDLRALAGEEPRGVYLLTVDANKAPDESRLLVVTDLGISARVAGDGVLVWVNSLRDARPVAGAEVSIYAENNQLLAGGATDTNGVARLACRTDDADARPFLVVARSGDDLSYIDLDRNEVAVAGDRAGRPFLAPGALEAFVFTERGVYRPGETVFLKALVRDSDLRAPAPFPVLFRVLKPDGRVFKDLPAELDALGSAEATATLPDYLPTGRYTLQLALPGTFTPLGETSVALEDFVPPQIRVDARSPAARAAAGEDLAFSVRAEHLFGRAASGLRAQAWISFRPAPFAPKSWKGWLFGDDAKDFTPVYRTLSNAVLDEAGATVFEIGTESAWRPPAAIAAACAATVIEAGGRPVTETATVFIDAYPFYIGLKPQFEGTVRAGTTQQVDVVEVLPDGQAAAEEKPLQVVLARSTWTYALKKNSGGRYEYVSEEIITPVREDTVPAGGVPAVFSFAAPSAGSYVLTFKDAASGASSSFRFSASSPEQEWIAWSRERPDTVELTPDRTRYRPGERARVMIKAPFSGLALLTVETDHILESRVIRLRENTAEAEIDLPRESYPNVYCCLTLVRPAEAETTWTAHRATGAVALPIEPPGRRLVVSIDAPATNRPQSALDARLSVRDESGSPVQGDAVLLAVDEAICRLTDFETPDPHRWFLAQRSSEVSLFDVYSDLVPLLEDDSPDAVSHAGGDEDTALRRRLNPVRANRFKPVALWASGIRLGTNGEASVSLPVPEFTGRLRLMAVAYNNRQAGAVESAVRIRRPLVVQPSLPRFLAPGDECEASIPLFNDSGRDATVAVRVTCGGPLSAPSQPPPVTLPNGGSHTVLVPLRAGAAPGAALCTIEVEGAGETYRESLEIAVRPAAGLQVLTEIGALAAGEARALALPPSWLAGSVTREVWCSKAPEVRLERALDYVMRYPYGCLEQTVSGAFPLLVLADLANRRLAGSSVTEDIEPFVRGSILRILSMQLPDGSFSIWPYDRASSPWASAYATHFLLEAARLSYDVPADLVDAAVRAVRARLDDDPPADTKPLDAALLVDLDERAYNCRILALAGKPDPGWNARLREQLPSLSHAARANLAAAFMLAGEPRQGREILLQTGMPIAGRPRDAGYVPGSAVRDAALLLQAWLEIEPSSAAAAELARFLEREQKNGHWYTTQDDAMALLALGRYVQAVPPDTRPFRGELIQAGGERRELSDAEDVRLVLPPDGGGGLLVTNAGPGTLYFVARSEGVPAAADIPEEDRGLAVRRECFDADGAAIDLSALHQGDLVIVCITLNPLGVSRDNLVIEELLPAGLEIENPNLLSSQPPSWIAERSDAAARRDIRDDRLLLFTRAVSAPCRFYYAARAVTPGRFVYPPATAACMYDPEIRSTHGLTTVVVEP